MKYTTKKVLSISLIFVMIYEGKNTKVIQYEFENRSKKYQTWMGNR